MKRMLFIIVLVVLLPVSQAEQERGFTMDREFAEHFAEEWISAWNAHDLERILSHYTDDFRMSSPRIVELGFSETGTLQGKEAMREYWGPSLGEDSPVKMELIATYVGANGMTINYRSLSSNRLAAEILLFDDNGLVHEAFAHYAPATAETGD